MTDPSQVRKKRKITIKASPQGVERAEKALIRLGFESKINFAKSQLLSRSTVTKFFQRKPIQLDSFKRICEALKLNWGEIAEIIEESKQLEIKDCSNPDTNEGVEPVQTLDRQQVQIAVIDKQSKITKVIIILEGDRNSVNNNLSVSIELILQKYSGDTIKITDIQEGSIRLIIEGSQEDIKRLVSRIKSGELTEVSGFPVEDIQILSESLDDESNELDDKWRLVQEIASQAVEGRNLSGADLSDADLSNTKLRRADLSGADLSGADLSGADLSGANLSGANLSDADLRGADLMGADLMGAYLRGAYLRGAYLSDANLSRADLSDAYLRGADLSGADLSRAAVNHAQFVGSLGISQDMKIDLERRGAIFDDSPGDRESIYSPVNR